MGCETVRLRDGTTMIICSRGRRTPRCGCGNPSTKQCDYPLRGRVVGRTCSRHLCDRCAVTRGPVTRLEALSSANLADPMVAAAVGAGLMPTRELVEDTVDYCAAHAARVVHVAELEAAGQARAGGLRAQLELGLEGGA